MAPVVDLELTDHPVVCLSGAIHTDNSATPERSVTEPVMDGSLRRTMAMFMGHPVAMPPATMVPMERAIGTATGTGAGMAVRMVTDVVISTAAISAINPSRCKKEGGLRTALFLSFRIRKEELNLL